MIDTEIASPRPPVPGLSGGPESLVWTAVLFALLSCTAAGASVFRAGTPTPTLFAASPPQFTPEQVTAWVTAACSMATLVVSTGVALAQKIMAWRKGPKPKPRPKPKTPRHPPGPKGPPVGPPSVPGSSP